MAMRVAGDVAAAILAATVKEQFRMAELAAVEFYDIPLIFVLQEA